jgi:hypothetical protein
MSIQNLQNGPKIYFCLQISQWGIKNAEFYADSKFIVHKKAPKKSEKCEKL